MLAQGEPLGLFGPRAGAISLEHGVLQSKQLTERFLFVARPSTSPLPFRFSADRGRRIQKKMERVGPGPCHNSDSGSENSSIKKASGNLVRPHLKGCRMAGLRTRRNSATSKF